MESVEGLSEAEAKLIGTWAVAQHGTFAIVSHQGTLEFREGDANGVLHPGDGAWFRADVGADGEAVGSLRLRHHGDRDVLESIYLAMDGAELSNEATRVLENDDGTVTEGMRRRLPAVAHAEHGPSPCQDRSAVSAGPKPLPRWAFFSLSILLVMGLSLLYTLDRVGRRPRREEGPPVARLLDPHALHHVGLLTSNLSRSVLFYTDVLGGRALGIERDNARVTAPSAVWPMVCLSSDRLASEANWSLIGFGPVQVMLWEKPASSAIGPPQTQFAFRMAHSVDPSIFLAVVNERLALHVKDLHGTRCEEHVVMQPEWDIVSCHGPDQEMVQFWKPSLSIARQLDVARKAWLSSASDSRGRDIFE